MTTHTSKTTGKAPAVGHRVGKQELQELIEPVCVDLGYELVELEYKPSGDGGLLRIFIDRLAPSDSTEPLVPGATVESSISFDDCEKLSHELSAILDVEDAIAHKYNLEVSSPGIDRPLRTAAHFRRYAGQEAKVSLREGLDGRRNFKGTIIGVAVDGATVGLDVDGTEFPLPLDDLASAKLVPDWDLLMKNRGKKG